MSPTLMLSLTGVGTPPVEHVFKNGAMEAPKIVTETPSLSFSAAAGSPGHSPPATKSYSGPLATLGVTVPMPPNSLSPMWNRENVPNDALLS